MQNVDSLVEEGKAAIKAGRKDDARRVLSKAVELNEGNEQAWLWLSAVVETPEEQQICLENVLAINPANEKASKGLKAISQQLGKKPAAPPTPDPFGNYDGNPFAGTGFDSNPYGSSTGGDPALSNNNSWEPTSSGSAHGSGKEINLPSPDEYDSWVSGLSIGGNSPQSDNTFGSDFGQSGSPFTLDFDAASDPFGGSNTFDYNTPEPAAESSYSSYDTQDTADNQGDNYINYDTYDFGGGMESNLDQGQDSAPMDSGGFTFSTNTPSDTSSSYGDSNAASSFSPANSNSGYGATNSFGNNNSFDNDDIFGDSSNESSADANLFSGKADIFAGRTGNAFSGMSPMEPASKGGLAFIDDQSDVKHSTGAYFRALPAEIQTVERTKPDMSLIATVGVLALLNMVSFALLLLNLINH